LSDGRKKEKYIEMFGSFTGSFNVTVIHILPCGAPPNRNLYPNVPCH